VLAHPEGLCYSAFGLALRAAVDKVSGVQRGETAALVDRPPSGGGWKSRCNWTWNMAVSVRGCGQSRACWICKRFMLR